MHEVAMVTREPRVMATWSAARAWKKCSGWLRSADLGAPAPLQRSVQIPGNESRPKRAPDAGYKRRPAAAAAKKTRLRETKQKQLAPGLGRSHTAGPGSAEPPPLAGGVAGAICYASPHPRCPADSSSPRRALSDAAARPRQPGWEKPFLEDPSRRRRMTRIPAGLGALICSARPEERPIAHRARTTSRTAALAQRLSTARRSTTFGPRAVHTTVSNGFTENRRRSPGRTAQQRR